MSNKLELLINNQAYYGWTSASISRSIETLSGGFSLELADKWQDRMLRWPVKPGDECVLRYGHAANDVFITGYVDKTSISLDAGSHSLSVSGRDKTADLVDCSAVQKPDQWNNQTLTQIARVLAAPFGVTVTAQGSVGDAIPTFKLQPGEKAFDAIERICRMRAVLATSDGLGGIVFITAGSGGKCDIALEEGVNVLSISGDFDFMDRFSEYTVKGQQSGTNAAAAGSSKSSLAGVEIVTSDGAGNQGNAGDASKDASTTQKAAAPASGRMTDAEITRYRPLVIVSESEASAQTPAMRAAWEATVRAARSVRLNVVVQGWRQALPGQNGGPLWVPNQLVQVVSPTLDIDEWMLVVSCQYELSGSGTTCQLTLGRPDAYKLLPEIPKGNKKGGKSKSKTASGLPPGTEIVT